MEIAMDAAVPLRSEQLASVLGAEQLEAAYIDQVLIRRIDANLREVHGSRIKAIHAGPGFPAVRRFIDAACLEAARPLLVLHILALAAQLGAIRPLEMARNRLRLQAVEIDVSQGNGDFLLLLAAHDLQRNLVALLVAAGN